MSIHHDGLLVFEPTSSSSSSSGRWKWHAFMQMPDLEEQMFVPLFQRLGWRELE